MSAPTGPTASDHLKEFEAMLIGMDPTTRDRFVGDFLDWLHNEVVNVVKAPAQARNARMKELFEIFVLGNRKPSEKTLRMLQEITTILFYSIGDASLDSPIVRLNRAMSRRAKLYNTVMALMGLPPMEPPEVPTSYSVEELKYAIGYLQDELDWMEAELAKLTGAAENPVKALDNAEPEV